MTSDTEPLKDAQRFLARVGAGHLGGLLEHVRYDLTENEEDYFLPLLVVTFSASTERAEALSGLSDSHKERILRALASGDNEIPSDAGAHQFKVVDSGSPDPDPLLPNLFAQQQLMVAVATGGPRIQDVDDYYKIRRAAITEALTALDRENPNPHDSLWDWYRHYKDEGWGYHDRRRYIWDLFDPLIEAIVERPPPAVPVREPTGWERVDRGIQKARGALDRARDTEDFQGVGLLCRELIISLAQAVFDPEIHEVTDGVRPSDTDAYRMLEAFVNWEAGGSSNEGIRRHAKAVLKLAVEVQHKRTADFRIAALSFEAASSLVNVVAILSGRRDR